MSDTPFLIWSNVHGMWWGPNRQGYTPARAVAGRYTQREAGDIVTSTGIPNEQVAVREICAEWWQTKQEKEATNAR